MSALSSTVALAEGEIFEEDEDVVVQELGKMKPQKRVSGTELLTTFLARGKVHLISCW